MATYEVTYVEHAIRVATVHADSPEGAEQALRRGDYSEDEFVETTFIEVTDIDLED